MENVTTHQTYRPSCDCVTCKFRRAAFAQHSRRELTRQRIANAASIVDGPELFGDLPERVDGNRRLA